MTFTVKLEQADGTPAEPSSRHRIRLQAQVHRSEGWKDIVTFEWWAPPSRETMSKYLTYANAPAKPATTP
jgi:hypothetical protein